MYENKYDADNSEEEMLYPGYLERKDKINRINRQLELIAEDQKRKIEKVNQ
jgi:hypothetical protein